jgi:uncharacterized membrane protein YhaH (DUF805 family)
MSWFLRRGRLDRKTFWLKLFLPVFVATLGANRLDLWLFDATGDAPSNASIGEEFAAGPLIFIASAVLIVPLISSTATRLHDTGRSAWWLLVASIPVVGVVTLIYFCSQPGQPFPNQYGPPLGRQPSPWSAPPSGGYAQHPGLQ